MKIMTKFLAAVFDLLFPLQVAHAFEGMRMSEDALVAPLGFLNGVAGEPFGPYDVGGSNASSAWVSMADFDRIYAEVRAGTTINDALTTMKLQQATDSSGAGAKDLTTTPASNLPDAAGDMAILEARGEDMDSNNGFVWARLYIAATGDVGTDEYYGFLVRHSAEVPKAHQAGAPASDTLNYITPAGVNL